MSTRKLSRRLRPCAAPALLAALALLPAAAGAAAASVKPLKVGAPTVSTGGVSHVLPSSAELLGAVDPRGLATSYFFRYGPTVAYGKQTTPATLPAGALKVKVGQVVTGLLNGYHYRLIASNADGVKEGKDRTFSNTTSRKAKFTLTKPTTASVFGGPLVLSGLLAGGGNAGRQIVLQQSPYPFLAVFATIGTPMLTNAAGGFTFHLSSLSASTQFRVSTLDPRPLYSSIVTAEVAYRVTLKVRSSSHKGLVRLYGTVTPAAVGAHVSFQLRKAVRPGKSEKASERTSRFATQFSTVAKRGTKSLSRFSAVVTVRKGGSYRAEVQPTKKGPIVAGDSASVLLHSAPAKKR